jgi:hypothetical protein
MKQRRTFSAIDICNAYTHIAIVINLFFTALIEAKKRGLLMCQYTYKDPNAKKVNAAIFAYLFVIATPYYQK